MDKEKLHREGLYICAGAGGKLIPVDTRHGKAPHTRHVATISKILSPFGTGKNLRVLQGEIAATRCGKYLRHFDDARNHSLNFTDGSVYSVECETCFGE